MAINHGDTLAYDKISKDFFRNSMQSDFYFYSMTMAIKHNYSRAYYNLYLIMNRKDVKVNGVEMYDDSEMSRKFANYFLLKSYELGSPEGRIDVKSIYKDKIPSSTEILCGK